jgi:hypothetical protein
MKSILQPQPLLNKLARREYLVKNLLSTDSKGLKYILLDQ